MGPGLLIAIDVTLLYLILGPLVLFGIYVFFDFLGRRPARRAKSASGNRNDPALWSDREIRSYMDQL